jgi:hypothetical protein
MGDEQYLQAVQAAVFGALLEMIAREQDAEFARAHMNGTLAAIAHHLVKTVGPQPAYEAFQRLADECAAPLLEQRA